MRGELAAYGFGDLVGFQTEGESTHGGLARQHAQAFVAQALQRRLIQVLA